MSNLLENQNQERPYQKTIDTLMNRLGIEVSYEIPLEFELGRALEESIPTPSNSLGYFQLPMGQIISIWKNGDHKNPLSYKYIDLETL
jgi:hypothetical protein